MSHDTAVVLLTRINSVKKGGSATLHHRHQSSMLNGIQDAGGGFSLAQDVVTTFWAGLQIPSAPEVWRHVETATMLQFLKQVEGNIPGIR